MTASCFSAPVKVLAATRTVLSSSQSSWQQLVGFKRVVAKMRCAAGHDRDVRTARRRLTAPSVQMEQWYTETAF